MTEFVSSTDDNGAIVSLQSKIDQVMAQLSNGDAVITYDTDTETCHIQLKKNHRPKRRKALALTYTN